MSHDEAVKFAGNEVCKSCGQVDQGQSGEYPCAECGIPAVWDECAGCQSKGVNEHTTACKFDHFLAYTGYASQPADLRGKLWVAYSHGAA